MLMMYHLPYVLLMLIYFALLASIFTKQATFKYKKVTQISSGALIIVLLANLLSTIIFGRYSDVPETNIVVVSTGIFAGHALISWLFDLLDRRFHQDWLRVIYYIGMGLVVLTSYYAGIDTYAARPIDGMIGTTVIICSLVVACTIPFFGMALLMDFFTMRHHAPKNYKFKPTQDKLHHYHEHGLSEQEIVFFRQQMAEAKERIENIEVEMNKVAKLRVIENRHNVVAVSKQYFKDIVKEPERVAQAGIFLNKLLPSLEDLTAKYTEISSHVAKNKQTYLILEKSAQTIDNICESITESYVHFHQSLYNDLQDDIKLANRTLNKEIDDTMDQDTIDELVSDPFNFEEE